MYFFFQNKLFMNTITMLNSLYPDQDLHFAMVISKRNFHGELNMVVIIC